MNKVEVVRRLQSLLFAYDDNLMIVDRSFDLLEVFLAEIVQIYPIY